MMHPPRVWHDYKYFDLVADVLKNGVEKRDRTGTGTISVFSRQMRFGLHDGTIPLLTSKKMHTRSIIHEILWYLSGSSNTKYLQDNDVRIWNEWSSPEGHLNKVYGFQWRNWEVDNWTKRVIEVPIKNIAHDAPFVAPKNEQHIPDTGNDNMLGRRLQNNQGDWFTVMRKVSAIGDKNSKYLVQFEQTTTLVEVLRPNLRRGQVEDPYKITVFGQGCRGQYKECHPYHKVAYNLWYNMMRRCYDPNLPEYALYGGAGVFVDQSWRCFSNFLRDIHDLVYFTKWSVAPSKFELDKDYFGGEAYSKQNCIFLPKTYNQTLPNLDGSKYIATNRHTGKREEFTVQRWFARAHRIKHSQVISTAINQSPTHQTRDWIFEVVRPRSGYLYRQQLFVDQIRDVIERLKTNPTDRRLIVSAWNVQDVPSMNLPPCHYAFQFWTRPIVGTRDMPKYELSCMLNQRSCDVGLGVPFNIVQYSILTRMIAQVVGMRAGEFIWNGGDVHIYTNHIDALQQQIQRDPYPSPMLGLNLNVTDIDSFKFEDFTVVGYESHPAIKMEVSV